MRLKVPPNQTILEAHEPCKRFKFQPPAFFPIIPQQLSPHSPEFNLTAGSMWGTVITLTGRTQQEPAQRGKFLQYLTEWLQSSLTGELNDTSVKA